MYCQTLPGYNVKFPEINDSNASNKTYSGLRVEFISAIRLKKYQALLENYDEEKKLFPEMIAQLPAAETRIRQTISTISNWEFVNSACEITDDGNAVFKVRLNPAKTLYLGLNLKEEDRNKDTYFAYYVGKKCEQNGAGSFNEVLTDLASLKIL